MATHSKTVDNLKYVCGICGASYARAFALNDHVKLTHPNNEYECEEVVEEYEIVEEETDKNDEETVYAVVMKTEEN
jgi:hypothetical protein